MSRSFFSRGICCVPELQTSAWVHPYNGQSPPGSHAIMVSHIWNTTMHVHVATCWLQPISDHWLYSPPVQQSWNPHNLGRNMLSALNMSTFAVCIQFLVGIEVSSYPTLRIELRCLEQSDCDQQSDCPLLASGDRSERVRLRHDLPIAGM